MSHTFKGFEYKYDIKHYILKSHNILFQLGKKTPILP